MKKKFTAKISKIIFFGLILSSSKIFALNAISGGVTAVSGNVYATWVEEDVNQNFVIKASSGAIGNPGGWSISNLSNGISSSNNNNPAIISNSQGDVVVIWEYFDPNNFNGYIAASILPANQTSWTSATISDNSENAGLGNENVAIDDNGNVIVTWTSLDLTTQTYQVRGATFLIGVSTNWSAPFTISQ